MPFKFIQKSTLKFFSDSAEFSIFSHLYETFKINMTMFVITELPEDRTAGQHT